MPAPIVINTQPSQAAAQGIGFTLTVNGVNFGSDVAVTWGSTALTTTFVNQGQCTATVTAALIQDAGNFPISVATGGLTSNTVYFVVAEPSTWLPNAIDLITVADLKNYLYPSNTSGTPADDTVLQMLVTAASGYIAWRTKRTNLNRVQALTERYDGTNQAYLYTRQYPIVSVASLSVYGRPIPASLDGLQPGWVIDQGGRKIDLIGYAGLSNIALGAPYGFPPYISYGNLSAVGPFAFYKGVQNISLSYSAGYDIVEYELQEAMWELVSTAYKRRGTIDLASLNLPQGGNQGYRAWEVTPKAERIIQAFTNRYVF